MNVLVDIHCVCYNKSTSIVMSFFRPGISPGLFLCYNIFKKVKKDMQWKDISMKFLLGGFVYYKEQMYSVVGTNQLKRRLHYNGLIVPIKSLMFLFLKLKIMTYG